VDLKELIRVAAKIFKDEDFHINQIVIKRGVDDSIDIDISWVE
jgi:hypothetical protein